LVLGIALIVCITLNVEELSLQVAIGWDEMLRDDLCKGIFTMELEDEDEVVDTMVRQIMMVRYDHDPDSTTDHHRVVFICGTDK